MCGLDPRFEEFLRADSKIYKRYYPSTAASVFSSVLELRQALRGQQYDIVHLFSDVLPNGMLTDHRGNAITGTELLDLSCESDVKLFWLASDNPPERYIDGFNARGKRINLVLTIMRNDPKFSEFLENLLFRMFYGDTMPVAWVDIVPQIPGRIDPSMPATIFYAGRGAAKLR